MKTNRKFLFILLMLFNSGTFLQAQKAITPAGGNGTGSGGSVSFTIGQIDYVASTGTNGKSNQGVQHPHEIYIVSLDPDPTDDVQLSVYPNPASSHVFLTIQNMNFDELSYQIYDITGVLMDSDCLIATTTQIPFEKFASGNFILKVLKGNSALRSFKIIKK